MYYIIKSTHKNQNDSAYTEYTLPNVDRLGYDIEAGTAQFYQAGEDLPSVIVSLDRLIGVLGKPDEKKET